MLDQFVLDVQALAAAHTVHVGSGAVQMVRLVAKVQILLLGGRHPERVQVEHLPVAEHQLRTRQARRLLANVLREVQRLDDGQHGVHVEVVAARGQIGAEHFAVTTTDDGVHFACFFETS